jgi:ABC-type molybdate transport system substrate-binding protein
MRIFGALMVLALYGVPTIAADTQSLKIYSAGSLRVPLTEIINAYTAKYGTAVEVVYGASGLLAKRLENGEPADLYTSADRGGPESLADSGKAGPTVTLARNHLCAVVRPGLKTAPSTILKTMLDPSVRVGTSNPQDDPGGAYAWTMFERADRVHPGSRALLEQKAIKLGSGAGMVSPPPGVNNALAWLITEKQIDVILSYCTNGHQAEKALTGISTIELPPELAITASYGMTILNSAHPEAARLAMFILSPAGQKILMANGFDTLLLP